MTNAPRFIVQEPPWNDPQLPPPYRFEDVSIQSFLCAADGARLTRLCDRFFNDVARANGSTDRIYPLAGDGPGIVQILLQRYPKMVSLAPGYEASGYSQQNELTFVVPVVLRRHGIPTEVGVFAPYLFVDNTLSLISGRDAIGFAKVQGEFTMPTDPAQVDGCKVETLAARKLTQRDPVQPLLLFATEVDPAAASDQGSVLPDDEAKPLWPFGPVDQFYGQGQVFALDVGVQELLRESAGVKLETYALKQFRDAVEPDYACYQAITAASTYSRHFHLGGVLPKTRITLNEYGSLHIGEALGLPVKGNVLEPFYSFWYRADFDFKNLRHLSVSDGAPGSPGRDLHHCGSELAALTATTLRVYEGLAHAWLRALQGLEPGNTSGRRGRKSR